MRDAVVEFCLVMLVGRGGGVECLATSSSRKGRAGKSFDNGRVGGVCCVALDCADGDMASPMTLGRQLFLL